MKILRRVFVVSGTLLCNGRSAANAAPINIKSITIGKFRISFDYMLSLMWTVESYAQKPTVATSNEEGWQHIGQVTASFKAK